LAQHYSLLDFAPRRGWERHVLHRSPSAAVGDLILTCGYTSAIQGVIGESVGRGSIKISLAGRASYGAERRCLEITAESPVFSAPDPSCRSGVRDLWFSLPLPRQNRIPEGERQRLPLPGLSILVLNTDS
jgi:hypothetical protein